MTTKEELAEYARQMEEIVKLPDGTTKRFGDLTPDDARKIIAWNEETARLAAMYNARLGLSE